MAVSVVKNLVCDWSTPERRLEIAQYWIERNQEHGIWGIFDRENSFSVPSHFVGFCAADKSLPIGGIGPERYSGMPRIEKITRRSRNNNQD